MGFLRIYLAYVVLLSHCPEGIFLHKISHPALAVQSFYAISGFYVQLLVTKFSKMGRGWIRHFYINRILRIYPTYLALLFITMLIFPGATNYLKTATIGEVLLYISANFLLITQGLMRFLQVPVNVLPQAWTLSLELLFYALSPLILQRSTKTIWGVIVVGVILRFVDCFVLSLYQKDWFYGFFPCELPIFLLGSLGYRFYSKMLHPAKGLKARFILALSVCISLYLTWFIFIGWLRINVGQWDGMSTLGVPLRYWCVLGLTIVCIPFLFYLSRNSKLDRYVGEFSYPLYLCHFLFISLFERHISSDYLNIVVLICSSILSYFILRFVEIPFANYRRNLEVREPKMGERLLQPG